MIKLFIDTSDYHYAIISSTFMEEYDYTPENPIEIEYTVGLWPDMSYYDNDIFFDPENKSLITRAVMNELIKAGADRGSFAYIEPIDIFDRDDITEYLLENEF